MDNIKRIRVFVGSPSDTVEERSKIKGIFEELNQTLGKDKEVYIQSLMWENDVRPTVGADAQDVINSQTRDYDIFVGMMWKKYGTPTPRANSATDEEYSYAINNFRNGGHCKDVIFMFSNKPFGIDDADADQIQKVKDFKKRVENDGVVYKTYVSTEEFEKLLKVALYQAINKLLQDSDHRPQKQAKKAPALEQIDERTKLVFDTLSISPAVNSVKSKFIESYILLFLFDKGKATGEDIKQYLGEKLRLKSDALCRSVIDKLIQINRLTRTPETGKWIYSISDAVRDEISNIKHKAEETNKLAISECKAICKKYDLNVDEGEIHAYIGNLFATNYSIDNGDSPKGAINREKLIKQVFAGLVDYIHIIADIPVSFAEPIAKEFVSVYSKNQSFYKAIISKMFLNMFHNEKLEEYLANTKRDLILDTQVLLQICCVAFDECPPVHPDILYNIGLRFWRNVKSNPMIRLYTTSGYVQEVAAHMQQAVNLSRFLSLDYIADLGKSKNIFFNHYMMIKDDMNYSDFYEYVSDLLGLEPYEIEPRSLKEDTAKIFSEIMEDLSITIIRHQDVPEFQSFKKEYETELSYARVFRSFEARINDINAAIIAGNYFRDFAETPYIVTHDSLFMSVRDRFAEKFQDTLAFWNVSSPQKISEMLSLMDFKVDPQLVDENIISLTESNFNTSNDTISFIDLLNTIVDQKDLRDWKLAVKLSKMRRLCKPSTDSDKLLSMNLPIDEILSEIINTMTTKGGVPMTDVRAIFCDNDYADQISNIIKQELANNKSGAVVVHQRTFDALYKMVESKKSKQ